MSESQAAIGAQEITWFWEGMEPDVRGTLTPEQRIAIEDAVRKSATVSQNSDFRLHLGKYFVRVITGKERRDSARLKQDLKDNPVFAKRNFGVIAVFWTLMFFTTLYIGSFLVNIGLGLMFG